MVLVRPFSLTFQEPILFLLNLYIALIYGLLYVWFESFNLVFQGVYHFDLSMEGLSFLGIFCGALCVIPPYFLYLYYVQEPQFDENGDIKPEKRLPPAFVGAFCIPLCLFWFGWTSRESIHVRLPFRSSILRNSLLTYLVDRPDYRSELFLRRCDASFQQCLELPRRCVSCVRCFGLRR